MFADYFGPEQAKLEQLARDGLVALEPEWLNVTPKGQLMLDVVCGVFDRYRH